MMNRKLTFIFGIAALTMTIAGCGRNTSPQKGPESTAQAVIAESAATSTVERNRTADRTNPTAAATLEPKKEVADTPQAVSLPEIPPPQNELADEEYKWNQLLNPDDILPIYEPEFAPAEQAPYADDELVIGVALNGQAKAYAIGPLNGREMVNDTVGGIPVLVSW